jgi:hypothetical protein
MRYHLFDVVEISKKCLKMEEENVSPTTRCVHPGGPAGSPIDPAPRALAQIRGIGQDVLAVHDVKPARAFQKTCM